MVFIKWLMMLLSLSLFSEDLYVYDELQNPYMMKMNDQIFCFSDQYKILLYNRSDGKLMKQLGRKGEGPAEFMSLPELCIIENGLALFDENKVVFFDKNKDSYFEVKITNMVRGQTQTILGDFIVYATHEAIGEKIYLNIFFKNYKKNITAKKIRSIEQQYFNNSSLYNPDIKIASSGEFLYISHPVEGFFIEVYNKKADLVRIIRHPSLKVKGTILHENLYYKRLEELFGIEKAKRYWPHLKKLGIPDILPDIRWMIAKEGKLYIQTYDFKPEEDRWLVFSNEGSFLGECWLPQMLTLKADIYQNEFFYLHDSEDGWVLKKKAINFAN